HHYTNRSIHIAHPNAKKFAAPPAPLPATSPNKNKSPSASDRGSGKPAEKSAEKPGKSSEAAASNQEGVYYVVQARNNLLAIVKADRKSTRLNYSHGRS